ncbi:MAG TPA: PTS glucose transporter subunit IIA, partial [Alphaproteobacteria bacterium]|nr:PTS glucose transporter subunit IIA [Alphaproteobacteria bacterium]
AFTLTFLFGVKDSPDEPEAAEDAPQIVVGGVGAPEVKAPVSGTLVPLGEINDKVFASGALGNGLGIVPSICEGPALPGRVPPQAGWFRRS